jgi:hypothetical protein
MEEVGKRTEGSLPTEADINPIPGDLDGEVAAKHFLGKSVQGIAALLDENGIAYQEDLMWMGPKAFCFYLPAFLDHMHLRPDSELAPFLASTVEFRLEHDADAVQPSFPTISAICSLLLEQDGDRVAPDLKQRLCAIRERIRVHRLA